MRILILSFYYQPDLSAGSFRTTALVKALVEKSSDLTELDVVTTLPNRYSTFCNEAPEFEEHPRLTIRRIRLPGHKSGMADQSMAFIRFAREAMRYAGARRYDLVYATSSRLMTAALGAWIARGHSAKLYLDIRDIFVDTIKDVLSQNRGWAVTPAFSLIERWTINRADRVNLVSRGFGPYFEPRYPAQRFSWFSNGIDDEFLAFAVNAPRACVAKSVLTVLYAGNIGEGQGLHTILPTLANTMRNSLRFKVIGDGGRKGALINALQGAGVENVEILPPMIRERLIEAYKDADVLFLHLNGYEAFKKVLPSKLFEYAAMGKPIWAGVAGYAADFVRSEIANAAVFCPGDAADAEKAFAQLLIRDDVRSEFLNKYARARIMQSMADDILSLQT